MEISFDGIGQVVATFDSQVADGDSGKQLAIGQVVALTGDGTVGLATAGTSPCGVIVALEKDQRAAVQVSGFAQVGYSGSAAPALGWTALAVDGSGGVQTASSGGRSCLVVHVDTGAKTAVIKL